MIFSLKLIIFLTQKDYYFLLFIFLLVAVPASQAPRFPTPAIKKVTPSSTTEKLVQIRGGALVSKETFVKVSILECTRYYFTRI